MTISALKLSHPAPVDPALCEEEATLFLNLTEEESLPLTVLAHLNNPTARKLTLEETHREKTEPSVTSIYLNIAGEIEKLLDTAPGPVCEGLSEAKISSEGLRDRLLDLSSLREREAKASDGEPLLFAAAAATRIKGAQMRVKLLLKAPRNDLREIDREGAEIELDEREPFNSPARAERELIVPERRAADPNIREERISLSPNKLNIEAPLEPGPRTRADPRCRLPPPLPSTGSPTLHHFGAPGHDAGGLALQRGSGAQPPPGAHGR